VHDKHHHHFRLDRNFQHMQMVSSTRTSLAQVMKKSFQCSTCSKLFFSRQCLQRHIRTHTKERPFECSHCGKKFTISSNLKKHINAVHLRFKPYICKICNMAFGYAAVRNKHMLLHVNKSTKRYDCKCCGKHFTNAISMRKHECAS